MKRSVRRKRVKVIGLLLCLMVLALWVFSVMFWAYYAPPSHQWYVAIAFGQIEFFDFQGGDPGWYSRPNYQWWKAAAAQMRWTEFAQDVFGLGLPAKSSRSYHIPLWLLVVAVGFPTAFLWWRDRRPKAGLCKVCRYDLTGNVSGTCPECGTAVINKMKA